MRLTISPGGRGRDDGWLTFAFRGAPLTRALLIASLALSVAYLLAGPWRAPAAEWLTFRVLPGSLEGWLTRPWTYVTYPFLTGNPLALLFSVVALFLAGPPLEQYWGTRRFALFCAVLCAVSALQLVPGALLLGVPVQGAGLTLPLCCLWVAWAVTDPKYELRPLRRLPFKLTTLTFFYVLGVFLYFGFAYGRQGPALAFFALLAPGLAFFWIRLLVLQGPTRRRRPAPGTRERVGRLNPLRQRREMEEMERLRRLLGEDDDGRPAPR